MFKTENLNAHISIKMFTSKIDLILSLSCQASILPEGVTRMDSRMTALRELEHLPCKLPSPSQESQLVQKWEARKVWQEAKRVEREVEKNMQTQS